VKIYLSSTFEDLKTHRLEVGRQLRRMRHDVIGMEDYVASDNRPVDKCVADVEACDIYIIIVAWRYGFVPTQDNEEGLSITEMEYRSATANGKPRLAFLLDENTAWPPTAMDSAARKGDRGRRVNALRDRLSEVRTRSIFSTPEHLANLVSASVTNTIAEMQAVDDATISPEDFLGVVSEFEASFAPTIEQEIQAAATNAGKAKIAKVRLGAGDRWLASRLYLLAGLADDFTELQRIVFTSSDQFDPLAGQPDLFEGLASPNAMRRGLARQFPPFLDAYHAAGGFSAQRSDLGGVIGRYVELLVREAAPDPWVSPVLLAEWVAKDLDTHAIDQDERALTPLLQRIFDGGADFVPLVRHRELEGIVDRPALADRIARDALRTQNARR
jgi:hypothetical protein